MNRYLDEMPYKFGEFTIDMVVNGRQRIEIWDGSLKDKNRRASWSPASVFIGEIEDDFEIIINVKVIQGQARSIAAIDHFEQQHCMRNAFKHEPCQDGQFQCANKKCIFEYQLCDGQNDCEDKSDEAYEAGKVCDTAKFIDFNEDGFGDIEHGGPWTLSQPRDRLRKGPTRSHRGNTHDKFAFLSHDNDKGFDTLKSSFSFRALGKCATFYIMHHNIDHFKAEFVLEDVDSGHWQQVYIDNLTESTMIEIQGAVKRYGYIAIDNIHFNKYSYCDSYCQNGGTCSSQHMFSNCVCRDPFRGKRCQDGSLSTTETTPRVTFPDPLTSTEGSKVTSSKATTQAEARPRPAEPAHSESKTPWVFIFITLAVLLLLSAGAVLSYRCKPWRRFRKDEEAEPIVTQVELNNL
ncbi:hypothetical protein HDE_14306 [Halotydeus destructor]|nr:hypothetical protein HDE_14306 [Halotydeus destructor]